MTSLQNVRYLSGFVGSAGILIVTPTASHLLVDGRYDEVVRAARTSGQVVVTDVTRVKKYDTSLIEVLTGLGAHRVAFEADHTTVAQRDRWDHGGAGIVWQPVTDWVESVRLVKDAGEVAMLREAARRLSDVASVLGQWVAVGRTEREVAADVDAALRRAGFEKPAFDTIVAAGLNSAYPHARPTDKVIQAGELVLLDFGGVLEGYCVDLTRMASAGRVGAEAESLYRAVRQALEAGVAAVQPGQLTSDVDGAARGVLERQQLGSAFVHGLGHGLGLDVHEAPRVGPGSPAEAVRLESGMVVTIEPGAYVAGLGGVRLEDDVLVTDTGREVLTTAPLDLVLV